MSTPPRRMHINYNLSVTGHHVASWRRAESQIERATDLDYYAELAAHAERGKLDAIFLADHLAIRENPQLYLSNTPFEPVTLLSALAARTSHIGLVGTISTSYSEPYTIARQIGSLNLLSKGRAGVNLVTSTRHDAARNYGREAHFGHAERYERAEEFAEILQGLWASWGEGAILADRDSGALVDTAKVRPIHFRGRHFAVEGPLNIPGAASGAPLVFQAGASPRGVAMAGRWADAVYARSASIEEARATRLAVRAAAEAAGRGTDRVKVLPGFVPYVAKTAAEAREILAHVNGLTLVGPELVGQLSELLEIDLKGLDLDGPVPLDQLPPVEKVVNSVTTFVQLTDIIRRENPSIQQLAARLRGAAPVGMTALVGDGPQIADTLEEWFREGAGDGFNIMAPLAPDGIAAFVDEVIPILQERGLFRTEYDGSTLRDQMGLQTPAFS